MSTDQGLFWEYADQTSFPTSLQSGGVIGFWNIIDLCEMFKL